MHTFDIWSEGYSCTGQHDGAAFHGRSRGTHFKDACINFFEDYPDSHLYDQESNTYWGCSLFDNEGDARKSFG